MGITSVVDIDAAGWFSVKWGELVELKYGKALKEYRDSGGEFPVFGTNGSVGFCDKPLCNHPGIIIGRKGAYRGVHYSKKPFYVIDTAFYVEPKKDINLKWAYYSLLLADINGMDSGSAIPSTSREDFYALPVKVPPRNIQDSIVRQLDAINEKIELNRQINTTLESMAQALFKSWFVDFDPLIDNALAAGNPIPEELQAKAETRAALGNQRKPLPESIRQQFPNRFVLTEEMGWVPEGWEPEKLSSRIDVLNGFAFKSNDYCDKGVFVLRTKNFNQNNRIDFLSDDVHLPESFLETHKKYLCEGYDYHLIMVGASVGNRGLILPYQLPALRNQNMWCFRPREGSEVSKTFAKQLLDSLIVNKMGLASGSAREFFRKGDFQNHLTLFGSSAAQNMFAEFATPYLERVAVNSAQNHNLTKTRDALLPKLLSGELRIPDAEAAVEKALA